MREKYMFSRGKPRMLNRNLPNNAYRWCQFRAKYTAKNETTDSFLKIFKLRIIQKLYNYQVVGFKNYYWLPQKTSSCLSDDWTTVNIDGCYLFTSAAFVFNPFNDSSLHFSQKRSSSHFNARGSLSAREATRILSWDSKSAAICDNQNNRVKPKWPRLAQLGPVHPSDPPYLQSVYKRKA